MENGKVISVKIDGVDVPASYYTATEGQTVTVGFNSAGLAHLKTKPNSTIEVVFAATVKSIPADGNIRNTAKLYVDAKPSDNPPDTPPTTPNDIPPGTPDGGTPTNEVVSSWGDVKVLKQDKDNAKALEGAVFQVYNATDPYAADCSAATRTGDPIAVGGVNEFTSDATGVVSIAGLFVDSKAGSAREDHVVFSVSLDNCGDCIGRSLCVGYKSSWHCGRPVGSPRPAKLWRSGTAP